MTAPGWTCLWIVAAATFLTGCQRDIVVIEEEPLQAADVDPRCVADILVDDDGQVIWKGEAISNAEFDRRLKDGRIAEVCVERKTPN